MSRDVSGNYTLPGAVNPVVAGKNITVTWANSTLNDIAAALTDSLSRSGSGSMTAALKIVAGTVAAPGISFATETSSGWYLAGAGDVRFSLGGVQLIRLNAGVMTVTSAAATNFTATNLTVTNLTLSAPLPVASGGTGATTDTGARAALSAAKLGANADITSMSAVTGIGNTSATHLTFASNGDLGMSNTAIAVRGFSIPTSYNIGWSEGANSALAVSFRQTSTGSLVLGSGVSQSATAGGFASSYASSWARSAIAVGSDSIKFYVNSAATVAVGTDVTMIERRRITSSGESSVIPGGSTLYPDFACRAWVYFNGSGTPAPIASGNVTSITDNGVGDYTVNFTTNMPDANYAVVGSAGNGDTAVSAFQYGYSSAPGISSCRVSVNGGFALVDRLYVSVAFFR